MARGAESRTDVSSTKVLEPSAGSAGAGLAGCAAVAVWAGALLPARGDGLAGAAADELVDERRVVVNSDSLGAARPLRLTRGRDAGTGPPRDGGAGAGPPSGAAIAPCGGPPERQDGCPASPLTVRPVQVRRLHIRSARRCVGAVLHPVLARRSGRIGQPVHRPGAEAALPLGVGAQGSQEVDVAEVGPVGLAEVELAVCFFTDEATTE